MPHTSNNNGDDVIIDPQEASLVPLQGGSLQPVLEQIYRWLLSQQKERAQAQVVEAMKNAGLKPRLPLKFRSQVGEDLILWELFEGRVEGTYLEVGAYDGVTFSPSYVFDAIGWNGVLIEASPSSYLRCRSARPGARVVHAAATSPSSPPYIPFLQVESMFWEAMSNVKMPQFVLHEELIKARGIKRKEIKVPAITLDQVVQDLTARLDFVIIDVEGHEAEVLKGFDLRRWRPRVLIMEDISEGGDSAVTEQVEACGYVVVRRLPFNVVLIHECESELLGRACG